MALALLPYPDCAIPSAADEFQARWGPITRHDGCDVGFVNVAWSVEMSDVEGVEVVVFGG